jgi:Cu/Ag efflux pump CusA
MKQGVPQREAIILAGETRMQPILMTTIAMIAGMLPIALGIGAGSEARAPMAIAVIGGLVTSTVFTLVVIPVVFTYVDDFQKWLKALVLRASAPDSNSVRAQIESQFASSGQDKK